MYTACGGQVREIESLLYRVRRKKEAETIPANGSVQAQ